MKISRNAILKNVGPLLENAPEKIYGLVARLLDEKELTEAKEAELKRQADAMKSLYDDQKSRFQEAVRENGVLTRLLEELRGKVESLNLNCARFKAKFEEAIGRIGQLEDALADAKEEKVEAVNHNRELQEKLEHAMEEKGRLDSIVKGLQEQIVLGNKDRFGHASEKSSELFRNTGMDADPLEEDAPCDSGNTERCVRTQVPSMFLWI